MDTSVPNPMQQPQPTADGEAGSPPMGGASLDSLAQAIEHVESIIAQTPGDPAERARQIQAVKDAYLQSTYNVTRPGAQNQ